ncbi:hypothetical protein KBT16_31495 [Nostoc sp. CCCryo 231-06]|nr:hypothetical protein [Nostoc sp. CCCryo 231-06]
MTVNVNYTGQTKVLCAEHDYRIFTGLESDLSNYARGWKGSGWDDLKVNVQYAEGTAIYVSNPIITPFGQPEVAQVILDNTHIQNTSDKTISTKVVLRGSIEQSVSVSVTDSFSTEISSKVGGDIKAVSVELGLTTTISTSSTSTNTETKKVEYEKSVEIAVDPGKAYDCQLIATVKKRKYQFDMEARIDGSVRIQYPSPRDGHYYWIFLIDSAWHNQDKLSGIISDGFAIDAQILVSNSSIKP